MSSSDNERILGRNIEALSRGEKCLVYTLYTHDVDKVKILLICFYLFLLLDCDSGILQNVSSRR